MIKRKGVDYLIKAFKLISNKFDKAVLVIVGGKDFYQLDAKIEERKLKKLVRKLNLEKKVIFTGHVPHKKVKKYYQSADIFVCPSITTSIAEPWGFVIEEAMSFGLPVIATDAVGAAYDLIKNGKNGFIVEEKNVKMLAKIMERLLKNKKLRKQLGDRSRKTIKKINKRKLIKKWKELLLQ